MAPFVVDTDNASRSSPVFADTSPTRIVMTADTQSKSSRTMESFAIEDGCYYSEFFESGDVNKSNDMSNTSTFCSWYSTQTETHPLLTSSLTGGICACVGDVIAQFIENGTNLRQDSTYGLHYRRTLAVFTAGLCYGPLLQTMYATLDHILPIHCKDKDNCLCDIDNAVTDSKEEDDIYISAISREIVDDTSVETPVSIYCYSTMFHSFSLVSTKEYVNAFVHVAIDQGIMAYPFVALMMFVTGIVEGHWDKLGQEFSEDYIDNIHALWLAALFGIGPLQIIAFRYLDLKWRALAANLLDVLEVMVMSYLTHRNREAPQQYESNDDDSWNYETHDYKGGSADD